MGLTPVGCYLLVGGPRAASCAHGSMTPSILGGLEGLNQLCAIPSSLSPYHCRVELMPMSGTHTTRRLWILSTSSPPARPARRSSRCCGVREQGGHLGINCGTPPSESLQGGSQHWTPTNIALCSHRRLSCTAGAGCQGLLQQLRPDQPQCESWRRHHCECGCTGLGGHNAGGEAQPCPYHSMPIGAGAACRRALEGLHPRQSDRQRPRGLLPLQPRGSHKQANRQILPHLYLPNQSQGAAQP